MIQVFLVSGIHSCELHRLSAGSSVLFYRIPLTAIIGDHGNDYYSCAYEIIQPVVTDFPLTVCQWLYPRWFQHEFSNGEKQNAYRVFKGAMIFALFTGTVACMIVFFGAEELTRLFKTPLGVYALQVLAPTLIIVAVLGVFRGFFPGHGNYDSKCGVTDH